MTEESTESTPEATAEVVETPAAEAPPRPAPPTPRAAEALRTLMDRERSIRESETALKSQSGEIERAKQLLNLAKANPLQFLNHVGTSYEDVTQQVLQGQRPDPTMGIKQELASLRKEFGVRQEREESFRRQAALDEARSLVTSYVDSSDQYPLTRAAGMQDLVFQRVHDHYNNTGEALSEASAAKEVEEYLSGVVDKLSELESVKSRFAPKEEATETLDVTELANTLTNAQSAFTPTSKKSEMLSERESLRQAAALLEYVNNT